MRRWSLVVPLVGVPVLVSAARSHLVVDPWVLVGVGGTFLAGLVAVMVGRYEIVGGKDGRFRFGPCCQYQNESSRRVMRGAVSRHH